MVKAGKPDVTSKARASVEQIRAERAAYLPTPAQEPVIEDEKAA